MKNQQNYGENFLSKVIATGILWAFWIIAIFSAFAFAEWSSNPGEWTSPSRVFAAILGIGLPLFIIPQVWADIGRD